MEIDKSPLNENGVVLCGHFFLSISPSFACFVSSGCSPSSTCGSVHVHPSSFCIVFLRPSMKPQQQHRERQTQNKDADDEPKQKKKIKNFNSNAKLFLHYFLFGSN